VHPEVLRPLEELRHVALRVVEVAEGHRLGDAGVDRTPASPPVDAGLLPVGQAGIDAIGAERGLGGHGEPRIVVPLASFSIDAP